MTIDFAIDLGGTVAGYLAAWGEFAAASGRVSIALRAPSFLSRLARGGLPATCSSARSSASPAWWSCLARVSKGDSLPDQPHARHRTHTR